MTIASATNKSGPYNGNGVTVAFAGTFKISDQDHVQVILADADGVETVQTITTEYTVSGVGGSGFTVTMLVAPPSGSTVTLIRDVPFTQELDLQNQGAYYAETIEEAFDAGVARDQQLQEQVSRSVKIPASADVAELDTLIANIVLLGDSADDLAALAAISADVETLSTITAQISTVAGISVAVTTVAGISVAVQSVAAVEAELLDIHSDLAALLAVPAAAAASASAASGSASAASTSEGNAAASAAAAAVSAGSLTAVEVQIHAATSKATPVDADELGLVDSAASNGLKKLTWANLKAGVFAAWGALINGGTGKTTPVDADAIAIMDSAASNATKKLTWANLKATLKTYFDTLYTTSPDYQRVATISASASVAINFDTSNGITIADDYDYIIKCINVKPSTDVAVAVQYGTGVTPTYQTSGYTQQSSAQFAGSFNTARDGVTTGIQVTSGMGGASAGETFDAEITISRPGANAIHKAWIDFVGAATDGLVFFGTTSGWRTTAEVLTGIRIVPSTGSFTTGTFVLYRRKVA